MLRHLLGLDEDHAQRPSHSMDEVADRMAADDMAYTMGCLALDPHMTCFPHEHVMQAMRLRPDASSKSATELASRLWWLMRHHRVSYTQLPRLCREVQVILLQRARDLEWAAPRRGDDED